MSAASARSEIPLASIQPQEPPITSRYAIDVTIWKTPSTTKKATGLYALWFRKSLKESGPSEQARLAPQYHGDQHPHFIGSF